MPKLKSNRAAAKRFKKTKGGKLRRYKAFNRHLKSCKSAKRRRNLRHATLLAPEDEGRINKLLPY